MTALIAATRRRFIAGVPVRPGRLPAADGPAGRGLALATLALIALTVPDGVTLLLESLSEAYLAVAVFVAGTLLLLAMAERGLGTDLGSLLRRHARWQVPIAAVLGAFPGCGGAIIALTQFTRGHLSLGGVVATLTATMGDAMFLLLAQAPATAGLVLGVSMVVGVATGWIVDAIHGEGFLRPQAAAAAGGAACCRATALRPDAGSKGAGAGADVEAGLERLWLLMLGPGIALGLLAAFRVEPGGWVAPYLNGVDPVFWFGVIGAAGALALWVIRGREAETGPANAAGGGRSQEERRAMLRTMVSTTSFVTAWVVFAFAAYELMMAGLGLDPGVLFAIAAPLVPAIAVAIGLIPGCGPQIVVTTLYLSGVAPLSAQMGNAIANDGDALFPAIAVAPRAALVATVYSAVPALLVGYGTYALMGQ